MSEGVRIDERGSADRRVPVCRRQAACIGTRRKRHAARSEEKSERRNPKGRGQAVARFLSSVW